MCVHERCERNVSFSREGIINYDTASYMVVVNVVSRNGVVVKLEAADLSETMVTIYEKPWCTTQRTIV
jgi:hypothetical protein